MAKKPPKKDNRVRKRRPCENCGVSISHQGSTGLCRECVQTRRIYDPDEDEIKIMCMLIRAEGGGVLHPFYRNPEGWTPPISGQGHYRKGEIIE